MVDTVSDDFVPALGIADAEGLERINDGRIVFESLSNMRDLGGIAVADGRWVVRERLIRSGELADATTNDLEVLVDDYDVRTVVDLRTEEERRKKPDPEDAFMDARFVSAPILNPASLGLVKKSGIKGLLKAFRTMESDPADLMKHMYASIMTTERGQASLSMSFQAILDTKRGAVLWHCTAGKDRTGVVSALLLHVLGASTEDIMADYLESNCYAEERIRQIAAALEEYHVADKLDETVRALATVRPDYLQAAYVVACEIGGNLDTYLEQVLHVTPDKQKDLHTRYLTEDSSVARQR